jgi:hypothetical protein
MASTKNPESKPINQKRGPTTGNQNPGGKREAFVKAKSDSSSEKSKLADFVMDALSMRGTGMKPFVNPALENVSSNSAKTTGKSKNPTADGAKLPSKYKSPKTKG